jgi:hypothetical protein
VTKHQQGESLIGGAVVLHRDVSRKTVSTIAACASTAMTADHWEGHLSEIELLKRYGDGARLRG